MAEIDTFNKFVVGLAADGVVILRPPKMPMSEDDALNLAAWLVSITGDREKFLRVLAATQGT